MPNNFLNSIITPVSGSSTALAASTAVVAKFAYSEDVVWWHRRWLRRRRAGWLGDGGMRCALGTLGTFAGGADVGAAVINGLGTLGSAAAVGMGAVTGGGAGGTGRGLSGVRNSCCMCRRVAAWMESVGGRIGCGSLELMVFLRSRRRAKVSSSLVGVGILQ